MATKKYKAPAGMHPEDAKDWEKFGTSRAAAPSSMAMESRLT